MGLSYGLDRTFAATAALTKNTAVIVGSTEGYCDVPAATNSAKFLGFAQDTATAAGDAVSVRIAGVALATAYSSISVGDRVYIYDTSGRVATIPTNATTQTYYQVGVALKAATATDNLIEVLIDKCYIES